MVSLADFRTIQDWPQQGVTFLDIAPVLADKHNFGALTDEMSDYVIDHCGRVDYFVALDARGFIFAGALAVKNNAGILMARKANKLPGEVVGTAYGLEYGTAQLEMQRGIAPERARVVLIDDVLATGGTLQAAIELCNTLNLNPVHALVVLEVEALGGRAKLDLPVHSMFRC